MTRLFHRCIRILFFVGVFLSAAEIDVVIPCHPKDFSILPLCVRGIRENGKDIRRIIVVTKDVRNKEVIKMISHSTTIHIMFLSPGGLKRYIDRVRLNYQT